MSKAKLYCLQDPGGFLIYSTIDTTKTGVWSHSFDWVSDNLGKTWRKKYWKREQTSMRSAAQLDWTIVKVLLEKATKP